MLLPAMRQLFPIVTLALSSSAIAEVSSADYTDPWQIYAHEVLRDSVAFKSVPGERQVVPLVEFLANKFITAGFSEADVKILPMTSEGEPVATLVVRYRGTNAAKRPVLFAGHTDVLPAAGEWERNPFELTEADGKYHGRGVLDDKFAVSILTTTFLRLRAEGFKPQRDLILVFFGDEETKMLTTRTVTENHLDLINAEFAFNLDAGAGRIGEDFKPIAMFIQFAEKMYVTFELTARNPGGHSSKPTLDNAIADLAAAITAIHDFDFPVQSSDETRAYFATVGARTDGELGAAMRRFAENPNDEEAALFLAGQPEQVGITRTTCVPTMLRGGHAENALPEAATATINCRVYPGVTVDEVEATLRRVVGNSDIEFKALGESMPSPASAVRGDVVALVEKAMADKYAGTPVVPFLAPYATDGVYLRRAGIPTYGLYGMFLKDGEDNSHSSNESLPIDRFYEALDFWYRLTKSASAL